MYRSTGYHLLQQNSIIFELQSLIFSAFTGGLFGIAIDILGIILSHYIAQNRLNHLLESLSNSLSSSLSGSYTLSDFSLSIKPDMKVEGMDVYRYIRVDYSGPLHPATFLFFLYDTAIANYNDGYITGDDLDNIARLILLLTPAFRNVQSDGNTYSINIPIRISLSPSFTVRCAKSGTCYHAREIARRSCNPQHARHIVKNKALETLSRISELLGSRIEYEISRLEGNIDTSDFTCEAYPGYKKVWARFRVNNGELYGSMRITAQLENPDEEPFFIASLLSIINMLTYSKRVIEYRNEFGFLKLHKELNMFREIIPRSRMPGDNDDIPGDGDDVGTDPGNPGDGNNKKKFDFQAIGLIATIVISIVKLITGGK